MKDQNPGVDLITSVDWFGFLDETFVVDRALPPLMGAGDVLLAVEAGAIGADGVAATALADPEAAVAAATTPSPSQIAASTTAATTAVGTQGGLPVILWLLLGGGVVAVLIGSVVILTKGREQ